MKRIFTQYSGLKREIYILFVGNLVTAMAVSYTHLTLPTKA